MPLLTRRRLAGLYLTARLTGLAALPALALPAFDNVSAFGDAMTAPHRAMTLMSHAGDVLRESVRSIRHLSDAGAWTIGD